jgi:tRNA-specific 2-thiouridylase
MADTVAVAISGGVDSSVAAALLKDRYDVFGVTMQLGSDETVEAAGAVCQRLDIPLHVIDLERQFKAKVIDGFCAEYRRGRTPNPCIACNRRIKFGLLLEEAIKLGATCMATGHYARIEKANDRYRLLKAVDRLKDQSYFLYCLGQGELSCSLFPLSGYTKDEVRRLAADLGLPTSSARESQEICFIPDNDYRRFLQTSIPPRPGRIVDTGGATLGRHDGVCGYTIGQRHGLGIASGERRYVVRIDADENTVVVGPEADLWSRGLLAADVCFVSGEAPQNEIAVSARIRYRAAEAPAVLSRRGALWQVRFDRPQRAMAPGQSVAFYLGEEVLGGGIIMEGTS